MRTVAIAALCLVLVGCDSTPGQKAADQSATDNLDAQADMLAAQASAGGVGHQTTGSAAGAPAPSGGGLEANMEVAAESAIKAKLRDPDSAVFASEHLSSRGQATVICGTVNSKNGFGGMSGAEPFISNGNLAFLESEMADGQMQGAWDQLC